MQPRLVLVVNALIYAISVVNIYNFYKYIFYTGLWHGWSGWLWRYHHEGLRLQPRRQDLQEGADNDPPGIVQASRGGWLTKQKSKKQRNYHRLPYI